VPTDWERFVYHAGRVRKFIYTDDHLGAWDEDTFQTLNLGITGDLLLPQLRELWWDVGEDNGSVFPFIRLFLGPHITRLHVCLEGYDYGNFIRLSLLHALASRYPSLAHFQLIDVPGIDPRVDFVDAISHAVRSWSQLRRLAVRGLSPDALYHVALLPTLQWLALTDVTEDISPPLFSRSSTVRCFSCLQKLTVVCHEASFAIGLVEAISSSPLTSIFIESYCFGTSGYQDLINALQGHCSRSSLKSMTIIGESENDAINIILNPVDVNPVDVKPLFVFSNLTSVKLLCTNAQFELSDASLKDMAQAWPRITSLIIRSQSRVTLSGLVPLAQYCRRLRNLDIFFDACSVSPPTTEVKHKRLRCLNVSHPPVSDLPITEPKRVAEFINGIFPRTRLTYSTDTRWREVSEALNTYL
jgi:hypothetical protein